MMRVLLIVFPSALCVFCFEGGKKKDERQAPAKSIAELQQQINKTLTETHTPGVSVAIVHRDGPEWIAGLGMADVASSRAATPEALFHIGSASTSWSRTFSVPSAWRQPLIFRRQRRLPQRSTMATARALTPGGTYSIAPSAPSVPQRATWPLMFSFT
jgi:hypothetical protein